MKDLTWAYASRSFVGHLEGTSKSLNTIDSYRGDLKTLENFLLRRSKLGAIRLDRISLNDLRDYESYLKEEGFSTNSRRRKLLTVRRLFRYLSRRKKLAVDVSLKLPAPHKVERVPVTFEIAKATHQLRALPDDSDIQARNKALLWVLFETGCQVHEVGRLRFDQVTHLQNGDGQITFAGKNPRVVPVSPELVRFIGNLEVTVSDNQPTVFSGYNRYGPLSAAITARGVELLVRHHATRLGVADMTPRMIRHSVVAHWLKLGIERDEIQRRLGLKSTYAFRVFEPLVEAWEHA